MSSVKSRFRLAHSLEEAAKLIYSPAKGKQRASLKNYRGAQKLWDDGVYETTELKDGSYENLFSIPKKKKTVTLPKLKFMETKDKDNA